MDIRWKSKIVGKRLTAQPTGRLHGENCATEMTEWLRLKYYITLIKYLDNEYSHYLDCTCIGLSNCVQEVPLCALQSVRQV